MALTIICLSDTHYRFDNLIIPPGDILIHAGDFTRRGILEDVEVFNAFLGKLPHRHKLVVPGNNDFCCQEQRVACRTLFTNAHFLVDEGVKLKGLKFYGSPWQPNFGNMAFNLKRGEPLRTKWDLIPGDTDVLITHTPPRGFGDRTLFGQRVGCSDLLEAVRRIQPRLHVFGHIHEASGVYRQADITFINASVFSRRMKQKVSAYIYEWK